MWWSACTTHGDIGLFKIVSEQRYRGRHSPYWSGDRHGRSQICAARWKQLNQRQSAQSEARRNRRPCQSTTDKTRDLEKQLERLQQKLASNQTKDNQQCARHQRAKVLIANLQGMDGKTLRTIADDMKSKLHDGIVVLAGVADDKIALTASVGKDLTSKIKAGDIIKHKWAAWR